jgi:hypothetical protein
VQTTANGPGTPWVGTDRLEHRQLAVCEPERSQSEASYLSGNTSRGLEDSRAPSGWVSKSSCCEAIPTGSSPCGE